MGRFFIRAAAILTFRSVWAARVAMKHQGIQEQTENSTDIMAKSDSTSRQQQETKDNYTAFALGSSVKTWSDGLLPQGVRRSFDYRGNDIHSARAETLWAVRVIRTGIFPITAVNEAWVGHWNKQTAMDLLWAWIEAMQANGKKHIPFRVDPPMHEAEQRNADPPAFVAALHAGHKFKNGRDEKGNAIFGMDHYINDRLVDRGVKQRVRAVTPSGQNVWLSQRHEAIRSNMLFAKRGRLELDALPPSNFKSALLKRDNSAKNYNAGIATLELMPPEAVDFFDVEVIHGGKNSNVRTRNVFNCSFVFSQLGAPFIGGASGSIEYLILSMEEDCSGGCQNGLVPFQLHRVREVLIGLMTAVLIAGGQHSLTECLAVAQAMGYFGQVANVLVDYHRAARDFETYLWQLGIRPLIIQEKDGSPVLTPTTPLSDDR